MICFPSSNNIAEARAALTYITVYWKNQVVSYHGKKFMIIMIMCTITQISLIFNLREGIKMFIYLIKNRCIADM
jgi:hypothetical protein